MQHGHEPDQPGGHGQSASGPDSEADAGAAEEPRASAASDATASNRAPDKYTDTRFGLLWQGIDFLELSFSGDPAEDRLADLERLKGLAQAADGNTQADARMVLDGAVFLVKDRGAGLFKFAIHDDRFLIKIRGQRSKRLPLAFVQTRSEFLALVGAVEAANAALRVVQTLGTVEGEPTVSRIDLAADFGSTVQMDSWPRSAWVTRAEHRHAHSVGDRFSGWSIGLTGPVGFRLYDKLLEIVARSKKAHVFQFWERNGWFPGDPVWRAEFQLRRPLLAQFDLTTLRQVLDALPGLWAYLTGEWLRLTEPTANDENRARWPLHPLWACLQQVRWEGDLARLERQYKANNSPSDKYLARLTTALVTSVMAKEGIPDSDRAVDALLQKFRRYWQEQEMWEGAPAEQMLLDRALIKERKYGTHLLSRALGKIPGDVMLREPGEEG